MTIDRNLLSRRTSDAASRLRNVATRAGRPAGEEAAADAKPIAKPGRADYLAVKAALQARLLDEIGERGLLESDGADVAAAVRDFAARAIASEDIALNEAERVRLAEELTDETIGMGPLAPLLADPAISDILVNAPDQVYVERFGKLERTDVRFRDAEHIVRVIERIAARVGRRIDTASPMADLRLPDGSRVNATLPPVTIDGPTISIRRFGRRRLRRDDLLNIGTLSPEMMEFLVFAVRARKNILISGGTGAGKSTLLGVLAEAIPETERIVTIEDTAELALDQEHVVRMETRPVNIEGKGRILARDLLINALRMRPDRIIVGEVRGAEALDMLQALNTGHDGGIGTIHANSPRDAMARLETMVLMAGTELPSRAVREQIVSAIHLLVQVKRYDDGVRRIESVAEITGLEGTTPQMQELFGFRRRGKQGRKVIGHFSATGVVPRMVDDLREEGIVVPAALFQRTEDSDRDSHCARGGAGDRLSVPVVRIPGAAARRRAAGVADRRGDSGRRRGNDRGATEKDPDVSPPRYKFAPTGAGLIAGAALWLLVGIPVEISAAAGLLVGVIAHLIEDHRGEQQAALIESQLASAIYLMVGSLRAGASLLAAFESALEEIGPPLRPYFQEVAGRIRLGDDPRSAVSDLQVHVPLETFRLFSTSLSIHWEVGGSLATTLSTVGQTVRDRIELSRRVRAQSVESHASVAVVLGIAYILGFLMWRTNPDRLEAFVATSIGSLVVAGVIALQAVGLIWMARLNRSTF